LLLEAEVTERYSSHTDQLKHEICRRIKVTVLVDVNEDKRVSTLSVRCYATGNTAELKEVALYRSCQRGDISNCPLVGDCRRLQTREPKGT
jgi:hypothetical protein